MDNEVLIKVEGVKKKFCRSLKRSMFYGMTDIARDLVGLQNPSETLRKDEFWSLDDISFEVKRGECLGIIGHNGAGKSTLLKMLNGIILPDAGKITMTGKVGTLIEVGAGFHPMLSGRENIYINGAILGMSKEELDNNFDSIVDFAELKDAIDMPVKHYSSGMYVRLGFAIAAHVKPDILILDEVLAVGDISFVAKCFQHLSAIRDQTAIILVSHDMRNVSRICDKTLLLDKGRQISFGEPEKVVSTYRELKSNAQAAPDGYNSSNLEILSTYTKRTLLQHENAEIVIRIRCRAPQAFVTNLAIYRDDGTHCFGIMSTIVQTDTPQSLVQTLHLQRLALMPGHYQISIALWDERKTGLLAISNNLGSFTVLGAEDTHGIYMPEHNWTLNS